jgi:hypothetical protein
MVWIVLAVWVQSLNVLLIFLQLQILTGQALVIHCDGVLNCFQLSRKNLFHSAHKLSPTRHPSRPGWSKSRA